METSTWRKASQSGDQGQCVEVYGDLKKVRDSKNPQGPMLSVPASAVAALAAFVKSRS